MFLVLVAVFYCDETGIQNPGRNDAKYRLSSVRIPVFWHVESDMCMEVKKETTNYPIVLPISCLVVLRI